MSKCKMFRFERVNTLEDFEDDGSGKKCIGEDINLPNPSLTKAYTPDTLSTTVDSESEVPSSSQIILSAKTLDVHGYATLKGGTIFQNNRVIFNGKPLINGNMYLLNDSGIKFENDNNASDETQHFVLNDESNQSIKSNVRGINSILQVGNFKGKYDKSGKYIVPFDAINREEVESYDDVSCSRAENRNHQGKCAFSMWSAIRKGNAKNKTDVCNCCCKVKTVDEYSAQARIILWNPGGGVVEDVVLRAEKGTNTVVTISQPFTTIVLSKSLEEVQCDFNIYSTVVRTTPNIDNSEYISNAFPNDLFSHEGLVIYKNLSVKRQTPFKFIQIRGGMPFTFGASGIYEKRLIGKRGSDESDDNYWLLEPSSARNVFRLKLYSDRDNKVNPRYLRRNTNNVRRHNGVYYDDPKGWIEEHYPSYYPLGAKGNTHNSDFGDTEGDSMSHYDHEYEFEYSIGFDKSNGGKFFITYADKTTEHDNNAIYKPLMSSRDLGIGNDWDKNNRVDRGGHGRQKFLMFKMSSADITSQPSDSGDKAFPFENKKNYNRFTALATRSRRNRRRNQMSDKNNKSLVNNNDANKWYFMLKDGKNSIDLSASGELDINAIIKTITLKLSCS
jgi:hypothetical protein